MNKGRDVITGIDKSKDSSMPQSAQRYNQCWKGGGIYRICCICGSHKQDSLSL